MTHDDDDMPQFIPEAVPIGTLHVLLDDRDQYDEWAGMNWPISTAEHLVTFRDGDDLHACFRATGNTLVRMPLSLLVQAADIIREHYQDVDEGETT